jgi:hypothetical protein
MFRDPFADMRNGEHGKGKPEDEDSGDASV